MGFPGILKTTPVFDIKVAADAGSLDCASAMLQTLLSFKHAGANSIITCSDKTAAKLFA
ncbi:MAG: hypothetical protein OEV87_01365 [Phycisphaerae bacterium]|nr:hypothetical protein [Phycisphaerae bacterium]